MIGQEMPKLVVGLIYTAMINVYESEKATLNSHWDYAAELAKLSGVDLNEEVDGEQPPYTEAAKAKLAGQARAGVLGNFILVLLRNLYAVEPFRRNYPHYFCIMSRFASLGPEAREFLVRSRAVGRFLDFFYARASIYRDHFSRMWDLGPSEATVKPELGLPTTVDDKMLGTLA